MTVHTYAIALSALLHIMSTAAQDYYRRRSFVCSPSPVPMNDETVLFVAKSTYADQKARLKYGQA